MALDFPANPTNGQTFGQYIYDTSIPGWRNVNSSEGIGLQFKSGLIPITPSSVTVSSGSATVGPTGAVTLTAVGTFYVNGIYTAEYDRYLVTIDMSSGPSGYMYMRHATNGAQNTSGVSYGSLGLLQGGTSGLFVYNNAVAHIDIGYAYSGEASQFEFTVINPYRNDRNTDTLIRSTHARGSHTTLWGSSVHADNTRFDGIYIYTSGSSPLYATMRVYGFRN